MLPDGPGFAEAFAGTIKHQAVPLPVNPLLAAHDIAAAATKTGARLLLASTEQIHTLTDLGKVKRQKKVEIITNNFRKTIKRKRKGKLQC